MEKLGENAGACFKSIFMLQIPNSIDPYRWNTFAKCCPVYSKNRIIFSVYRGSKLVLLVDFRTSLSLTLLLPSAVGSTILSITYGIQIQDTNDPFINLAETAVHSSSAAASVGLHLVDVIPILKYIPEFVPGAGFQKQARIWRKLQEDFREQPYLASVEAIVFY